MFMKYVNVDFFQILCVCFFFFSHTQQMKSRVFNTNDLPPTKILQRFDPGSWGGGHHVHGYHYEQTVHG